MHITYINLPGVKRLPQFCLYRCTGIHEIYLPDCQKVSKASMRDLANLRKIHCPKLQLTSTWFLSTTPNLEICICPSLQEVTHGSFRFSRSLRLLILTQCKKIDPGAFPIWYSFKTSLPIIYAPKLKVATAKQMDFLYRVPMTGTDRWRLGKRYARLVDVPQGLKDSLAQDLESYIWKIRKIPIHSEVPHVQISKSSRAIKQSKALQSFCLPGPTNRQDLHQ